MHTKKSRNRKFIFLQELLRKEKQAVHLHRLSPLEIRCMENSVYIFNSLELHSTLIAMFPPCCCWITASFSASLWELQKITSSGGWAKEERHTEVSSKSFVITMWFWHTLLMSLPNNIIVLSNSAYFQVNFLSIVYFIYYLSKITFIHITFNFSNAITWQ